MNIAVRVVEGVDGPIILGAWCETCDQESLPMRDNTCGWCDTPIIDLGVPLHMQAGRAATTPSVKSEPARGRPRITVREIAPHRERYGREPIPTDDLIAALQRCATLAGGTPSLRDYDRLISRPSHRTVWRRFGSWSAALTAAGLDG